MRASVYLIGFVAFVLLSGMGLSAHAQTLKLAANEKAVEQAVAVLLLKDIYARAGLSAAIEPLPAKRANLVTLEGGKDGETARITPYSDRNPPLIRVDPPYYYLNTGVFAKAGRKLKISGKTDLANYRVGVVRGVAHAERAIEGLTNVTVVNNYDQLYRMIEADRVDLVVDTTINGRAEIFVLGLRGKIDHVADIAGYNLHNILHPRNTALAERIGAVIKAMQASGELDKLTKKYEEQVIASWGKAA
jgi:polar amino acid transport system substrate-binding protein